MGLGPAVSVISGELVQNAVLRPTRARNSARGLAISNLCLTSHCGWLGCMSKKEKRWSRRRPASVLERVMTRSCEFLLVQPTCSAARPTCWPPEGGVGAGWLAQEGAALHRDHAEPSPFHPKPSHWFSSSRPMPSQCLATSLPDWFASCGTLKSFVEEEIKKPK